MAGWGFCQYSILYPQAPWGFWHIVYAVTMSYYQMFGELFAENVIRSRPFDMPTKQDAEDGWCTSNASEYSNYERIRCPDTQTNWIIHLFLMVFLLISNLLLLNLLIAIFSNTFEKIQSKLNYATLLCLDI